MEEIKNKTSPEQASPEEEKASFSKDADFAEDVKKDAEPGRNDAVKDEAAKDTAGQDVSGEAGPGGHEGEAESEASAGTSADGRKGFFWKKDKKDPKDEKIAELTDRLKRSMAEFDNFRKRTEKEKASMYEIGAKDVIEKILPVVDNLERGLAAVPEDAKGTPFAEGMDKIYRQFMKTLEDLGVTPIEAVGKEFDPNFHNAVMHIEDESLGENIVAQELQKGYMYRESVVRHSMVQVAN